MNGNRVNADNIRRALDTMTTRLLSENTGVSEVRDGRGHSSTEGEELDVVGKGGCDTNTLKRKSC